MIARNFAYMDMGDWASLQRDLRYPCDGSHRVASWDRALSRRGTYNQISMEHMLSLALTAPFWARRTLGAKRVYIQSYTELLTCTLRGVADRVLNT